MDTNPTFTTFLPSILGALFGALASMGYSWWLSRKEHRSLILAFCAEFVLLYERCSIYAENAVKEEISYSALFNITDASILSNFTKVSRNAEASAAIIELKAMYFQIQRLIEAVPIYALEKESLSEENKKKEMGIKAIRFRDAALAFFEHFHREIEKYTEIILNTTKKEAPGDMAWQLSKKYEEAKTKTHNCLVILRKSSPRKFYQPFIPIIR